MRRTYISFAALLLALAVPLTACDSEDPAPEDAGGADATPPPMDAGPTDAGEPCTADTDCDDGLFCNGPETCSEDGVCAAGAAPACGDGVECTRDFCSEERAACVSQVPDADGDGYGDAACVDGEGEPLGEDCDDEDANRFPGNAEVCDLDGHDEDCDSDTHGDLDSDGDGVESDACCNPTEGGTSCGLDCDDGRRQVNPDGTETCDGIDDDCDGMIDEGVVVITYADADRDGRGDPATATMACAGVAGRVTVGDDCDDTRADRRPGQVEFCDELDNDCDENVDEDARAVPWYRDSDGDGFGDPAAVTVSCEPVSGSSLLGTDCDDTRSAIHPAAPELCDGIDNDCSGRPDYAIAPGDFEDDDADGYVDLRCGAPFGTDCRDGDASAGPGEREICDGRDNDCDDNVDEDVVTLGWFRDADGDGYGTNVDGVILSCATIGGHVQRGGDCDDTNPGRSPAAIEACDGRDQDCDVAVDESPASNACEPQAGAVVACVAGSCARVACNAGLGDCDGSAANGCETTLASSASHCGACGVVCGGAPGATSSCVAGACSPLVCTGGRLDCNGDLGAPGGDGCEFTGGACPTCVSDSGCDDGALCNGRETCDLGTGQCVPGGGPPDEDADGETPIACGGNDCDDARGDVRPGAIEVCDGVDQDCDGVVDDNPFGGGAATYYRDGDRDGSGDAASSIVACSAPPLYVPASGDCDDTRSDVRPGAAELCDGLDQDCDGSIDDGGVCTPTCPPGQIACGTRCVDPMTDRMHCGASGACTGPTSGTACMAGDVCSAGTCAPSCAGGLTSCDGRCRDVANDPMYCGGCSGACPSGPNAVPICVTGSCQTVCQAGYGDCDVMTGNGCEAQLATSTLHCGRCGNACLAEPNATRPCTAGTCGALTCNAGFIDCDGNLGTGGNGCETAGASCPRVLWATTWGDTNDDWNTGAGRDFELTSDAAGNLYAVGTYGNDITVAGTPYTAARFAGIVVSLTPTGTIRWVNHVRATTSGDATPSRILFEPTTGDVFIAGTGFGGEILSTVSGVTSSIGTQNGNCSTFVARLSAATGALTWGRTFPNASCSSPRGLARSSTGELIVAGYFYGTHVMDALSVSNPTAAMDGWVAHLSAATGTANALFRFGSATADEQVYGVTGLPGGDVVVVGTYNLAAADIGGISLTHGGSADAFHARFTRTGTAVHASAINTASLEMMNDVVTGPSGDYYVSGYYDGSTTVGSTSLSGSSYGVFLARVTAATGAYVWSGGTNGPSSSSWGNRRMQVDGTETLRLAWLAGGSATTTFLGAPLPVGSARIARVSGATGAVLRLETLTTSGGIFSTNAVAVLPDGRVATGGNFTPTQTIDGTITLTNAGTGYDHYVMLLAPGL